MSNQCFIMNDIEIGNDVHIATTPKSRKEHKCVECKGLIPPGEIYERVFVVCDGSASTIKTCGTCKEIRDAFFCQWYYGEVWSDLYETARWDDLPMCSFNGLSKKAIDVLSEWLDGINEGSP